ncbi:MAG: hydrogenase expression/formation protein HypE, partial [Gemmatimonadota bacterium]
MKNIDSYAGPSCPAPGPSGNRIQLGHGSGGRLTADLVQSRFLNAFDNEWLRRMEDGAILTWDGGEANHALVVSTDSFVVSPLEFPGGDIGSLAVNGTVNDLAMMGAVPRFLTAGFILEEGLPFQLLDRILRSMSQAALAAGVTLVAGDTKVVERGKADGMFINTTGLGVRTPGIDPTPARIEPGDRIVVSGPIGRHGITILSARGELKLETELESDTASLHDLAGTLLRAIGTGVHALRDPTRGGVASALNEMAAASNTGILLRNGSMPIPPPVEGACELLGLDPLYVANEGVLVAV